MNSQVVDNLASVVTAVMIISGIIVYLVARTPGTKHAEAEDAEVQPDAQ